MSDDDDGPPQLSAATLAALLSVRAESEAAAAEAISHALSGAVENKMPEDWGLAQFWTSPAASAALAGDLLAVATDLHASGREHVVVAFLSAPSAFQALLARPPPPWLTLKLLEFDTRFACFGDAFVHWNCVAPLTLPPSLLGGVEVFLIDPPRLNATTLADYASAISALARSPAPPPRRGVLRCRPAGGSGGAVGRAGGGGVCGGPPQRAGERLFPLYNVPQHAGPPRPRVMRMRGVGWLREGLLAPFPGPTIRWRVERVGGEGCG